MARQEGVDAFQIGTRSEQNQDAMQQQHQDVGEAFERLNVNDGGDYRGPNQEQRQELEDLLLKSEKEAMNAHVERLVKILIERGHLEATVDRATVDPCVEGNTKAGNNPGTVKTGDQSLIPRPELFRNIATRLAALRRHPASSEWETITNISETSNKEDLAPVQPLHQHKHSAENDLARAVRSTKMPLWMVQKLRAAVEKRPSILSKAARASKNKKLKPLPNSTKQIKLRPNIVTRIGEKGPELHSISPIPIRYDRAGLGRPSTPSIHGNGSELDCSSPLFLKSCEVALRGSRDLGQLCRSIPDIAPRYNARSNLPLTPNAKILKWLESIDIEENLEQESEDAIRNNVDIDSDDIHTEAAIEFEEPSDYDLKYSRRAFNVLPDGTFRSGPKEPLIPRRPVPALKALQDISNLRRPSALAKNSFAEVQTTFARNKTPSHRRSTLSASMKEAQLPPPDMEPPTAQRTVCSPRKIKLLNILHRPEQTASTFSFDPRIEQRDHIEYALACLKSHIPPAYKPMDFGVQKTLALRPISQEHMLQKKNPLAKFSTEEKAKDLAASASSFEPDQERLSHFEFTLARLEGRVRPASPSPIRRFVHPQGHYNENVEWEREPTMVVSPVVKRAVPVDGRDDDAEFGVLDAFDDGGRVESGTAQQACGSAEDEVEVDLGSDSTLFEIFDGAN